MKLSNSALRADLGNTLRLLQDALARLADHIRHAALDGWLWRPAKTNRLTAPTNPSPELTRQATLDGIAAGFQCIKYDDAQDPHESRIFPGLVAVHEAGIGLADEVNRHKAGLARILKAMDGLTEIGTLDPRTGERGPRPLREVALEALYFRRLQHWQATRRIEVLREAEDRLGVLDYVGFMWATSREVRRTSREALLEQAKAPDAHLMSERDIGVLAALPPKEPLAIVRPGHTIPKANLRWLSCDGAPATTKVRVAVLPLVMLGDRLPERLRKLPPSPAANGPRLPRVDVEIEPNALLQTYPVYRYIESVRSAKRRSAGGTRGISPAPRRGPPARQFS